MNDPFVIWDLVSYNIAEAFAICCINNAVYSFAEENNVDIPSREGFALPYIENFRKIFRDYVPCSWMMFFIHWAIDEAVSDFAEAHNLEFVSNNDFLEKYTEGFNEFRKVVQAKK